jgi:hypothetical protein
MQEATTQTIIFGLPRLVAKLVGSGRGNAQLAVDVQCYKLSAVECRIVDYGSMTRRSTKACAELMHPEQLLPVSAQHDFTDDTADVVEFRVDIAGEVPAHVQAGLQVQLTGTVFSLFSMPCIKPLDLLLPMEAA